MKDRHFWPDFFRVLHRSQQQPEVVARQSDADATPTSLNGHGIFTVIVFACVTLVVIQPLFIPVPLAISRWIDNRWRRMLGTHPDQRSQPSLRPGPSSAPETSSDRSFTLRKERQWICINHVTAPIIGILFLLATKSIGGEEIRMGIVGDESVEPFAVLALFIGLAYIAISVDATGLLRYLAFHVSIKGGRSGTRLYYLLYLFFFTLGLLVGNDPVILSGTAFLVHFTRITGISKPDAWIWAQFAAANVSSAMLVSSNPTNIVIAEGFRIQFTTYTAFMALPTLASGCATLLCCRLMFLNRKARQPGQLGIAQRLKKSLMPNGKATETNGESIEMHNTAPKSGSPQVAAEPPNSSTERPMTPPPDCPTPEEREVTYIPAYLIPPDVRPREALTDPFGAIYGSIVMAATLIVLIATSVTGGVEVFEVALPGAGLCVFRDIFKDIRDGRREKLQRQKREREEAPQTGPEGEVEAKSQDEDISPQNGDANSIARESAEPVRAPLGRRILLRIIGFPAWFAEAFPTVNHVLVRLPLPLLPFAFGMFILVESLAHVGFINIMAGGLGRVCASGGDVGTAFFIGYLSVMLCNVSSGRYR